MNLHIIRVIGRNPENFALLQKVYILKRLWSKYLCLYLMVAIVVKIVCENKKNYEICEKFENHLFGR
jgi:hypothetical protein